MQQPSEFDQIVDTGSFNGPDVERAPAAPQKTSFATEPEFKELAARPNGSVMVESQRAVQEVQAALIIAKRFPRDETAAYNKIMKACERPVLAQQAIYSLPISGQNKRGPSIRLAEVLAQCWGNLQFGIRELERSPGRSKCIAFCWDKESNLKVESEFEVEHWIEKNEMVDRVKRKVRKPITDPVEIDRLIANRGARKLRNAILNCIPGDVVDAAQRKCMDTQRRGDGKPLSDQVREMVVAFDKLGVNQKMIEDRLGHTVDLTTADELIDLRAIYVSINDKEANRGTYFNFPEEAESSSSDDIAAIIKGNATKKEAKNGNAKKKEEEVVRPSEA